MTQPPPSAQPAGRPTREELALTEIGHTEISPAAARVAMVVVTVGLALAPLAEIARDFVDYRRGERPSPWPTIAGIGPVIADAVIAWSAAPGGLLNRMLEANHVLRIGLQRYEDELEEASWFRERVQPATQWLLCRLLRAGNEPTLIGRSGVLYYGPELEHLAGAGFLDPGQLERRRRSGDRWTPAPQPDPVAAIVEFRDQLAARGIHLIVMPVPVKIGAWPAGFTDRRLGSPPLRNRSWPQFRAALERHQVEILDIAEVMRNFPPDLRAGPYLRTDTHWRPETMEAIAAALAQRIRPRLPAVPPTTYRASPALVTNRGDLAVMLNLPASAPWPAPEVAAIRQVISPDGRPWTSDPTAEVLLLGDSFANIFSLDSMRWGSAAGLAEHLSLALQRPVDRMVRNDAGAYATRHLLFGELRRRPERLANKRVVVWQFSERELSLGDWKLLSWPPRADRAAGGATP
ncbi:MAG: hypothetical protein N2652_03970 [Kiritimatiellae bacterium]|nr:hypothetical protein [Kiritimatiellia bacterium]